MTRHQLLVVSQHAVRFSELLAARQLPGLDFQVCSSPEPSMCKDVDILFGAPDRLVAALPYCGSLRWVQSSWAGVKPLIDQPRRDFQLTGVKDIFGPSMTEFVLAWLLALERKVLERGRARSWNASTDGHLYGKALGILGTGSLGAHLARACQALGMRVRGVNTDGRPQASFDDCYSPAQLTEFAGGLDYLVALLPDTPRSDRMVDARLLSQLNPGAILINGGRANSIDQVALLDALETGQLAHAVLDVLDMEPLPDSDPLWRVDNLHITSHSAAVTAPEAIVEVFCTNYLHYHAGKPLLHRIDFDKGY